MISQGVLKYGQIEQNITATLAQIENRKRELAAKRNQDPNSKETAKLEDDIRKLQDQLEGLKKSRDAAPDVGWPKSSGTVVDPNGTKGIPRSRHSVSIANACASSFRVRLSAEVDRIAKHAISTQGRL